MSKMSSRASSMKSGKKNRPKSRVTFTDELILADSIKYNDLDEVRATLKRSGHEIDLDKKNDLGLTILHQAVMDHAIELVNILMQYKANVNITNDDGWTPLHLAANLGNIDMSMLLLRKGADPTLLTNDNERPVDLVDGNDLQLESLLLNSIKLKESMSFDDENEYNSEEDTDYYYFNVSEIYKNTDEASSSHSVNLGLNDSFHSKKIVSILQLNSTIQSIIEEIEKTYNSKFMNSKKFIKSLAAAIFQSCLEANSIQETTSFNQSGFIYKINILKHFVEKNLEFEFDSLCGFYNSLEKLKEPFLVKRVFVILYETQTISKEGFDLWRRRWDLKSYKKEMLSHLKNFLSF